MKDIVPKDTRYIPFTQQKSCCVPTSIQMIMYRNRIPLVPAEELGYYLGLTVSPDMAHLFYNVRTSPEPPTAAGYGTQIAEPGFEPKDAFKKLNIPLKFSKTLVDQIKDPADLIDKLKQIEQGDTDALLCFNHGVIRGQFEPFTGHVVVFDKVVDGKIRIVDASPKHPKWRDVDPELMYEAMEKHGLKSSGGIWHFNMT